MSRNTRAADLKTLYELVEAAYDERSIERSVTRTAHGGEATITLRLKTDPSLSQEKLVAFRRLMELVAIGPI